MKVWLLEEDDAPEDEELWGTRKQNLIQLTLWMGEETRWLKLQKLKEKYNAETEELQDKSKEKEKEKEKEKKKKRKDKGKQKEV